MPRFHRLFKQHYPYGAPAVCLSTLGAPDPALFVMAFAAAIVLMPCALGEGVDDIARATRKRKD